MTGASCTPSIASQAAVADRLVLTKTDIAPAEVTARLQERLRAMNPLAPISIAVQGE